MRILVTGANGMLGKDLCQTLELNKHEVIKTDIYNLDITKECVDFLKYLNPDLVIHCAAYTNVDKAEDDIESAELINIKGTEHIAQACAKCNASLIYISTDYVFDGTKSEPYTPLDHPNPLNNYGLTKLKGEETVKKHCSKYYIARTSWLYGHNGKNFVETMLSLASSNTELKVVDDQIGCPTWTVDLANGLIKLLDKPYGTYHVCGGGYTSWYGFAKEIFDQSSMNVNLKPCLTKDFPRPAQRPKFSVMDNDGICRNWKLALKDYLELRKTVLV